MILSNGNSTTSSEKHEDRKEKKSQLTQIESKSEASPTFDDLILREKEWLNEYPQGKEWRDLNDRVIDDREFGDEFRVKWKYAKLFMEHYQMKASLRMSSGQTYSEKKEVLGLEIGRDLLDEVIDEIIKDVYLNFIKMEEKALDLLSKIVLNGVMDINDGNRRYLRNSGKIALLRGICSDLATNKNNVLENFAGQRELYESCIVAGLEELYVMKKANKRPTENKPKKLRQPLSKEIEKIYLYNASHPISSKSVRQQIEKERLYWECVDFTPLSFKYDHNKFGKITVTKIFSDAMNPENRGSIIVSATDNGRLLAWKVSRSSSNPSENNSIDLIASNEKQKGKDKLPIIDFKIPMVSPNTIITMNQEQMIYIWNLKFIFDDEKFLQKQEEFNKSHQSQKKSSLAGLFSCFSMFSGPNNRKFEIIIEKVFTINADDLSFQPYYSSSSLSLYPTTERNALQKVILSLNLSSMGGSNYTEEALITEKNKALEEKDKEAAALANSKSNLIFSLQKNSALIDRKLCTSFCCFRSVSKVEGEPESIIIGTHDGTVIKLNLDVLSERSLSQVSTSSSEINQSNNLRPSYFVDKEFVNPNVAPEGFILATHENQNNSSEIISFRFNQVFREIFHFHEASIMLLETIHEGTEKEKIISLDANGNLAMWNYLPKYFQNACWFTPEKKRQLSYEIVEFTISSEKHRPADHGAIREIPRDFDFDSLQCILVNDKPEIEGIVSAVSSPRMEEAKKEKEEGSPEKVLDGSFQDNHKADSFTVVSIDQSFLYYPIYSHEEDRWIQYEVLEGTFRKRARRFSSSNSPRWKSPGTTSFIDDQATLSVSPRTASSSAASPLAENTIQNNPQENQTLASKVVQRLRNTIISNLNQKRALRKHYVDPIIKNLKLVKSEITDDGLELVLLLTENSNNTEKRNRSKNDSTEDNSIYLCSIILDSLLCQQPYIKILLQKGEVVKDFAVGSLLSEPLSRPVYFLTNQRVLIYSLISGSEMTDFVETKVTKQRVEKEFQLHHRATFEKITVCPSNKVFILTTSRPPFFCVYRIRCELPPHSPLLLSFPTLTTQFLPPWHRSERELRLVAVTTAEFLEASTVTSLTGSILDDLHEYAISLTIDNIIKKLENDHADFAKSVMKTFYQDNLGFIEPITWPYIPSMASTTITSISSSSLSSTATLNTKADSSGKKPLVKEGEILSNKDSSVKENEGLTSEGRDDKKEEKERLAILRELALMTKEEQCTRELISRRKELESMLLEDQRSF